MSRQTKSNKMFDDEIWKSVNEENKELLCEFKDYLNSIDRSDETIFQYEKDLMGFFCWYSENCKNKSFVEIKKRDVMKYQNYLLNELGLSSSRIRRLKSSMSSLSNFIVKILDEDYPDFKNIINIIEAPQKSLVREKTILEDEDLKRLCDGLILQKRYQEACYFAVLASSGMRKSEAFRIKVDVFKDENVISGAIYKTPEKIKTKGRGKNGKQLNKFFIISILEPYLSLWLEQRKEKNITSEYLFANKSGEIKANIANYWCDIASKILNKPIYSHSFRHSLTTYMSKNNVPTNIIQEFNGWDSVEMVNLYDDNDAEDSFADYFGNKGIKEVKNKNIDEL